jgi:hypothetical protein
VFDLKKAGTLLDGIRDSLKWYSWPDGLFIPGAADWHNYWISPAPATNRYSSQWGSGGPNMSSASLGHLWSYNIVAPNDRQARTEAGVGFLFTPQHSLAVYRIEPSVVIVADYRWDISTTLYAGGTIWEWGGIYTAVWEVNPVDGSLDLVKPFNVATVFQQMFVNQGGMPIQVVNLSWSGGPATANVFLEGSRTYLVGIVAAVQIDNTWTNNEGGPVPPLPDNSTWKVWCDVTCDVPQVWVLPSVIYAP